MVSGGEFWISLHFIDEPDGHSNEVREVVLEHDVAQSVLEVIVDLDEDFLGIKVLRFFRLDAVRNDPREDWKNVVNVVLIVQFFEDAEDLVQMRVPGISLQNRKQGVDEVLKLVLQ